MNRWQRIENLFFEALERPATERRTYLETECAGDRSLMSEVEAMLAAHDDEAPFSLERLMRDDPPAQVPDPHATPDSRVGAYRLKSLLGEGGMGAVYLAERDDAQYRQQVALKLVRAGMQGSEIATRFRLERQILAQLQHPNIARLMDGGVTAEGRPYLVMEYVDGKPVTTYCDERRLTIPERLRLFQTVCRAVHHAHRNLIVHRDLKPTNILVTAEGEVKLLDFGIAKLLDPAVAGLDATLTRTDFRMMTPEYAAPEQVRRDAITTATDVYALGVLLYELLTGYRPYRLADRRASEIEHIICEQTPTRPSLVIDRPSEPGLGPGAKERPQAERAAVRGVGLERLRRTLRGDLDNIVMMALAKEPERRYPGAAQLADEIDRYLAGMPVHARRDTLAYRVRKFVRRHRTGVAVGGAFVLLLMAFSLVTLRQARNIAAERDVARTERDRAETALQQAEEVSEFLISLFEASDPQEAQGDTLTALHLLDRGVQRASLLADQPAVQARMLGVLGQVYRGMGHFEESGPLLEQATVVWRQHNDSDALAASLDQLALLHIDRGLLDAAENLIGEAYAIRKGTHDAPSRELAESLHNLAGIAMERGNYAAADSLLRGALSQRTDVLGAGHPTTVRTMRLLAGLLDRSGNLQEAEPMMRAVLNLQRRSLGDLHPEVATALHNLGLLLKRKGDLAGAEAHYREALEIRRHVYGDKHPRLGITLVNYGKLLVDLNDLDRSVVAFTEAIEIFRSAHGPDHADVGWGLENLARVYARRSEHTQAIAMYDEALRIQRSNLPEGHPRLATTLVSLARSVQAYGRFAEAESLLQEALSIYVDAHGPRHADVASVHLNLGDLYHAQDQPADAEPHFASAVEIFRSALPDGHLRTANALLGYGRFLADAGDYDRAQPLLIEAAEIRKAALEPSHPEVVEVLNAVRSLESASASGSARRALPAAAAVTP